MKRGPRVLALIDYDRSVTGSFSGDDADQYSLAFDLGAEYDFVRIECPTLNAAATVALYKHHDIEDLDEVPIPVEYQKHDNTSAIWARTSGTAAGVIAVLAGGLQYGRIKCSANQAANRSFYVQGFNM